MLGLQIKVNRPILPILTQKIGYHGNLTWAIGNRGGILEILRRQSRGTRNPAVSCFDAVFTALALNRLYSPLPDLEWRGRGVVTHRNNLGEWIWLTLLLTSDHCLRQHPDYYASEGNIPSGHRYHAVETSHLDRSPPGQQKSNIHRVDTILSVRTATTNATGMKSSGYRS